MRENDDDTMDELLADRISKLAVAPIAELRLRASDGNGTQFQADQQFYGWTRQELLAWILADDCIV